MKDEKLNRITFIEDVIEVINVFGSIPDSNLEDWRNDKEEDN